MPRQRRRHAAIAPWAALLLAFSASAPANFDVPSWQVGDSWRVQRSFQLDVMTDQGGGTMDVLEEFDLTVVGLELANGQLAYRLERSNDEVTGGGTITAPELGTLELNIGPASETTGYELVRAGDLAVVEESFHTYLDVRTLIVIFQVTVAEADFNLLQTSDPADEGIDFPVEEGNEWAVSANRRLVGSVMITFSDVLEGQIENVDESFDQMVDFSSDWSAGNLNGSLIDIVQTPGGQTYQYSDAFRRLASRSLPASQLGLQSFEETTLSATLSAPPSLDFSLSQAGTTAMLTGSGASPNGAVEIFIPERFAAAVAQPVADGSGNFSASFAVPSGDDSTPSNDDLGSFGVVARDAAGGAVRVRTLRVLEPPTVDSTGLVAY